MDTLHFLNNTIRNAVMDVPTIRKYKLYDQTKTFITCDGEVLEYTEPVLSSIEDEFTESQVIILQQYIADCIASTYSQP